MIAALLNRAVVSVYAPPPIPLRQFDWRATFVGYEPGDAMGWGATREEAISDLWEQCHE